MTTMTREEREAARARCEAATEGPWGIDSEPRYVNRDVGDVDEWFVRSSEGRIIASEIEDSNGNPSPAVAAFIAAARTDLPRALDAIDALEAELRNARESFRDLAENWDHDDDAHRYGAACRVCIAARDMERIDAALGGRQ